MYQQVLSVPPLKYIQYLLILHILPPGPRHHFLSPSSTQPYNWPLCFHPSPLQFIFSRAAKVIMLKHVDHVIPHLRILQWFSVALKRKSLLPYHAKPPMVWPPTTVWPNHVPLSPWPTPLIATCHLAIPQTC